jgi:DNA-binding transcriptional ArsR family regulator
MSWGEAESGQSKDSTDALRALAHPLRLRMLSLLTGAAMTAAEVARELAISHANASYHLRQLHAADLIEVVAEEKISGGVAKRYRYNLERPEGLPHRARHGTSDAAARAETAREFPLVYAALAVELQRRATACTPGPTQLTDAEFWVEPTQWEEAIRAVDAASKQLVQAARPPRTPGTVRVSATIALFPMESDR